MTDTGRRRRFLLASVCVPFVLASCGKKEPPAPQARVQETPSAAPATTLPPPTTMPTPPPVWRAARWGMTRDEVLAAFPGEAQRLAQPAPFGQPQPGSSLTAGSSDLAIPSYEADGVTFRVLFGFASKALDRIHLSAAKPGASTCEDLEKALTEKHAKPAQRTKTGSSLQGEEVAWRLPDQTIVLSCAGVPSLGFQTVTLDYLVPATESAKK